MRTGVRPQRDPSEDHDYSDAINSGTYDNAEHEQNTDRWYRAYSAQEAARERVRHERLKAGGDESLFSFRSVGEYGDPEPVSLSAGGLTLSYGVHRISGPAGDGKTRVAYWEILARVRSGEKWAIFDTEMGPERCKQAFAQLGADEDELKSILYVEVRDDITPDLVSHGRAMCQKAFAAGCAGVLYDSMTPFLAAAGLSENDPQGVRAFTEAACRPMANEGGTAIVIDHTGHEDKTRGRGSSDKSAGCDADMYLRTISPFAIGRDGLVQLTVTKDRSGTLAVGSFVQIIATCYENGDLDFMHDGWDTKVTGDGSDAVEALGLALAQLGPARDRDYVTAGELQAQISGQKQHKLEQIDLAVRSGLILAEQSGNSWHYSYPDNEE